MNLALYRQRWGVNAPRIWYKYSSCPWFLSWWPYPNMFFWCRNTNRKGTPISCFPNTRLFNWHPGKWFEGYSWKSTPFFSGWQKHLRFSKAWHPFFLALPYAPEKKWAPCPKKSHEKKGRFYRAPFIFYSGCRLNGGMQGCLWWIH